MREREIHSQTLIPITFFPPSSIPIPLETYAISYAGLTISFEKHHLCRHFLRHKYFSPVPTTTVHSDMD